ncbi:MAG: hypothetical protein JXQ90_18370 [Cyclobacteriaceae bacterium]
MDFTKILILVLSATGFWKLLDSIIKIVSEKKLNKAQSENLFAQANKEVVNSFLQLSDKLKKEIQEQEERIDKLELLVESERKRNNELEELVVKLEARNKELEEELNKLKNGK